MLHIHELEQFLSEPSPALIHDFTQLQGDILILGAGGKMGPSLALMARRALDAADNPAKVIAVSRFSAPKSKAYLEQADIQCIAADLLDETSLRSLPKAPNLLYMVGMKFGTSGKQALTWAMNTYLPGRVAETFPNAKIVAFSTGNIYPFMPVGSGGADEAHSTGPVGEYAQSCLGRERIFQYFSEKNNTPCLIYRLNYAIDLRYGVLLDIATKVWKEAPIDLRMGHVNVIWQGDANEYALRSLFHCKSPADILNVTGPETVSVKWLAEQFGHYFNKTPQFVHEPAPTALLNNAAKAHRLFGYPRISLHQMIEWTAGWVASDGEVLDKPTHFQEREGKF